jgi:diguanylate cyclase (GGDEF)-like protein/PAS domain S-box-containing protein
MSTAPRANTDPIRILMLEDNATDVELVMRQMQRHELAFTNRVEIDEQGFRAAIVEFAPQVILSDFSLPRFDGLTALRIARAEAPSVPFIFVSGTIGEERAIDALKSGASDYVLKENIKRLVPAIRSSLRQYEVAKARDLAEEMLRRSESRLQDIINASTDWIWECDTAHRFTFSSASVSEILGYDHHSMLGRPASSYVDARDRTQLEDAFAEVQTTAAKTTSTTLCWTHKNGVPRWLERKMVVLHGQDGQLRGFRGIDRDVTMRKAQESRISRLNRALRFLSDTNSAVVRIRDRHELLREACRIAVQKGGYSMATVYLRSSSRGDREPIVCRAVSSKSSVTKRPPTEPLEGAGPVGQAMATGAPVVVGDIEDAKVYVPDRETLLAMGLCACIALPIVVDQTPIGVVLLHADEPNVFGDTELALLRQVTGNITFSLQYLHSKESAEYLEYFDTLTALANRSLYLQRLDSMIKSTDRDGLGLVLLVFDISGLRTINDGLGHHVGDLVLQLVAERMKNVFRDSNCLCHLGGGRYAVASTETYDSGAATTVLRERVDLLFDKPFTISDQNLRITVTAGFAQFPEDGRDAQALLHHAQTALDHAKEAGEHYLRHSPDMNTAASERLNLTNRLREAVDEQQFVLNYQPKIELWTQAVTGFEALLRWPDSNVLPSVFVPMLESMGLVDEMGMWVIDRALAESAAWAGAGERGDMRVAVNVSPLQLKRDTFAEEVLELLEKIGKDPALLELEVTESVLMTHPQRAGEILKRLRDAGVTIAIDDFGTGHSSLQVLSHLPVDVLKIDRSFVQDLPTNQRHRLVVQMTISLAKSLGLKTVAEGVETYGQVDILTEMGCDVIQGYLILRPAPANEISAWLARASPVMRDSSSKSAET